MELSIAKINDYSKKITGVSQKLMMICYKEEVTQCSYEGYLFKNLKLILLEIGIVPACYIVYVRIILIKLLTSDQFRMRYRWNKRYFQCTKFGMGSVKLGIYHKLQDKGKNNVEFNSLEKVKEKLIR